jgi:signal transduction histidine kinase
VRRRLVVAIAGVAVAAVVLLAVPLGLVLAHSYRQEELLRLQSDTVAATRSIDVGPRSSDPVELPATRDRLAVYDPSGRLLVGYGPRSAPLLVRRAIVAGRVRDTTGQGVLQVAVPLTHDERITGAVWARRSADDAATDARDAWLVIGGIAIVIITLAVAAATVFGRRLGAPLERLAVSARRLGDGDFSARAAPAGIPEVDAVGGALASTAERLEDLLVRERAFTADASHQLRTPLAALRIELEAMQLRGDDTPELATALGQVDRLQSTVETLLAVARDTPRGDAEADLTALVNEVADRWRGPLAAVSRPLRIQVGPGQALARASPAVVGEVLDVLVSNALHHGAGAVIVRVRRRDGTLAVDVSDEGPGPPGDPELAFARRSGDAEGYGIGLALARSLAQAEQGRLTVERATFTLLLPAA